MYRRATTLLRLGAAALSIVLVTTACGSSAPTTAPSDQPSTQPSAQPGTQQPSASQPGATELPTVAPASEEPLPSFEPEAPPEPLQEPELTSVDEIAEALFRPELAEQALLSMIDELGIGLYADDGSPIRPGSELSDADFYMFESEARGLIAMLQEQDEPDTWITFRDFHAALAGMGFEGTAEELAAAYADAYAEAPDDPIVRFVTGIAAVDLEASFPRFGAWLLLLDGFVPPNLGGEQAAARTAAGGVAQGSPSPPRYGMWGRARDRIERNPFNTPPMNVDPAVIARVMSIVSHFSITVSANPPQVHEGHGGRSGSPSIIVALVRAAAGAFVSPFTGTSIVPVNPNPVSGLTVTLTPDGTLNRHGSLAPLTATTTVFGGVRATYTPNRERVDGRGRNISTTGTITATVPAADLVNSLYNLPNLGALASGVATGAGPLVVQWHDEIMHVELTNKYDVTITTFVGDTRTAGTDRFVGDLARVDDGEWVGTLDAQARGTFTGDAFGAGCTSSWNARQRVFVVAKEDPTRTDGNFVFQFYPGQPLTGSMGRGRCPPTIHKRNGEPYAPFNDISVTTPDEGGALVVVLPPKPGGTFTYPVPSPGGGITIRNTSWVVTITYPTPP